MSGAIPLLPLYAFMTCIGQLYLLPLFSAHHAMQYGELQVQLPALSSALCAGCWLVCNPVRFYTVTHRLCEIGVGAEDEVAM